MRRKAGLMLVGIGDAMIKGGARLIHFGLSVVPDLEPHEMSNEEFDEACLGARPHVSD